MRLADAIVKIQYDSSWGIWADTPFTPDSEARYGQGQFENGGVLDGKKYFWHGLAIGDWLTEWFEDDQDMMADEDHCQEAAERLIEEMNEDWHSAILTADQVAERLGVGSSTVRAWCADGVLKAWKPTPRSAWLITEAELAEFKPPKRGRPAKESDVVRIKETFYICTNGNCSEGYPHWANTGKSSMRKCGTCGQPLRACGSEPRR